MTEIRSGTLVGSRLLLSKSISFLSFILKLVFHFDLYQPIALSSFNRFLD